MISKIIAAIGISLMIYGAPCAFAQEVTFRDNKRSLKNRTLAFKLAGADCCEP